MSTTPLSTTQERIERSIYERIRLELLDKGYLPDIALPIYNTGDAAAQTAWESAINAIATGPQGFAIELFGAGSYEKNDDKRVPRIVIDMGNFLEGNLGGDQTRVFQLADDSLTYESYRRPSQFSEFYINIHLVAANTRQLRQCQAILSLALQTRGYLPLYTEVPNEILPAGNFFYKKSGFGDLPNTEEGVLEKVYKYTIEDVLETECPVEEGTAIISQIDLFTDPDGLITITGPDGTPICISFSSGKPTKTGATEINYPGDDADTQRGRGLSFFLLDHNNVFGNIARFTDTLGGQTYANDVVLDHEAYDPVTGDIQAYYRIPIPPAVGGLPVMLATQEANGYVFDTYSDWKIINPNEGHSIANRAVANFRDIFNFPPFNIAILPGVPSTYIWSSYTDNGGASGHRWADTNFTPVGIGSQHSTIVTRCYTAVELGLPPIPAPAPAPIGYNRPATSWTVSYDIFDEGWQFINVTDPYIPPANAIMAKLEKGNPRKLQENNAFGHKFRLTGINGGYINPSDGLVYDLNGFLSDYVTEFQLGPSIFDTYIIDHFTGLGHLAKRGGQIDYFGALANANSLTNAGFNDWFLPTKEQRDSLFDQANDVYPYDTLPFSQDTVILWTCSPFPTNPSGAVWYTTNVQYPTWSARTKIALSTQAFVRYHYI